MSSERIIRNTYTDTILEIAGIATTLALIIMPFVFYSALPDKIPMHYSFKGIPDSFNHKISIFGLPFIGFILYIGLSLLNYFVIRKNSGKITPDKHEILIRKRILRLMQFIKIIMSLAFAYIVYNTIQISLEKAQSLGAWFLPTFIVLITFVPVILLVNFSSSSKKK